MDAVKFLKTVGRICTETDGCNNCILRGNVGCSIGGVSNNIEELIKTVEKTEKWDKEHPLKTFKSDFLEKFPGAPMADDRPIACLLKIYGLRCHPVNCTNCNECWEREMK